MDKPRPNYCGIGGINNCTWELMQVKNHGFVNSRVIGNRYIVATTCKDFMRVPFNKSVMEDGKKEKVRSSIFEMELNKETVIIGSEHLSPLSLVTSMDTEFSMVTFSDFLLSSVGKGRGST
jgi:hypothetical protein